MGQFPDVKKAEDFLNNDDDKMTAFWRAAGLNYIQYSNVAAKVVRRCLKGDALKTDAAKREVTSIKFAKWEGGSKSARSKVKPSYLQFCPTSASLEAGRKSFHLRSPKMKNFDFLPLQYLPMTNKIT